MDEETYEQGMRIRRDVLGDAYVDKALAASGELGAPLQELVTAYCWGEVWGRPGLDRRTRSLLTIGMVAALNRPHEMRAHVRGARRNGCSREDVVETLVQAAVYCGVPAAVDGFRAAREVFDAEETAPDPGGG